MNNNDDKRHESAGSTRPNQETNNKHDDIRMNDNVDVTPESSLPYEDPDITNPEELATFPKRSKIADAGRIEDESESHLVNKRTPVRDGRNITRTDNNPDTDGYM